MATQFTNVISASVLIVAGLIARKSPAAHKRLMLMATIALTEPGLTRLYPDPWGPYFELGPWHFLIMDYAGTMLLMLGVGAYDLVTRRRLHPAYVFAAIWILANEITASWLYNQPWWAHLTTRLVGH